MKIVINRNWGGFSLTEEVARALGVNPYSNSIAVRTNPRLIKMLEDGEKINDLKVAVIPDDCTDYAIHDYDGMESVIYVMDGKIHDDLVLA